MLVVLEISSKLRDLQALKASKVRYSTISLVKIFDPVPDIESDQRLLLRTCIRTSQKYRAKYPPERFVFPDAGTVNRWYDLPRDDKWYKFFQRDMTLIPVVRENDDYIAPGLFDALENHKNDLGVFVKSTNKSDLTSRCYADIDEALSYVSEITNFSSWRPQEILVSDSIIIDEAKTYYGKHEYRLFIVNGEVSCSSIFSDTDMSETPDVITNFALEFDTAYKEKLPGAYCLDVALSKGRPIVVELNDIDASGTYENMDMEKFFRDVARYEQL